MGSANYKYKDGRVWIQTRKFQPYELLLPYGLTGVTDPAGNINAIRQPSAGKRGVSDIVDLVRGEPNLPQFQLETRLRKTQNYLFGLRTRAVQVQCHLGSKGRPDNYNTTSCIVHWERARRADLQVDRLAIIEGDNQAAQVQSPFMAEIGPLLLDLEAEFLSARTIAETEDATAIAMMAEETLEDDQAQESAGENGYLATKYVVGSAGNVANVWFTEDKGETWDLCSTQPFTGGNDISDILVVGQKGNHRVLVANGTTRPGLSAQVAYADVTEIGTTSWIRQTVGSVSAQYITALLFIDWTHVFAAASDGYIYKSNDGGASWTVAFSTGIVDINKLAGRSDGVVWAVGNSNLVVLSKDYGATWTTVDGPTTVADDYTAVAMTGDGTLLVGNNAGGIYGSINEGAEWSELSLQGITPTAVKDIKATCDSNIWVAALTASGGRVLRSVDGGASFKLWDLNLPDNSGVDFLFPVDHNVVWAVGPADSGSAFLTHTTSRVIGLS